MRQTLMRGRWRYWYLMRVLLLCLLGCWGPAAVAKNHLLSSDPADGAQLQLAPSQMVLQFDRKTRLTALSLQWPDGRVTALVLPSTQLYKTRLTLALPTLQQGRYIVRWTGRGTDHWYFSGAQQFELQANAG